MKAVSCIVIVMVAALVMAFAPSGEAVTCSQVYNYIKPCVPYVTGSGPLGGCCGGVKGLSSAAKTPADKQAVCGCLKSLAGSYSGVNGGKAAGLPGQCGVSLPYKISPSTDCSKVQ